MRRKIAFDETVQPSSRVQAASALIDYAQRLRQEVSTLPRLAAIESSLADHGIESPVAIPILGAAYNPGGFDDARLPTTDV